MSARRRALLLVATAAVGVYAMSLAARGFVRDDRAIIAENRLLRQGLSGLPRLLGTGYWEAVSGAATPIRIYRPLVSVSFLAQSLSGRPAAWPMHLANVLLHALVSCLVLAALRRRMDDFPALAGALLFAVLPVHAEAVSYLTSRSELLMAAGLLGAWLLLDPGDDRPRLGWGSALFCAGLLSKEPAVLFPAFLALSDWTFHGLAPWERGRLRVHAALLACAAAYLALRRSVLGGLADGGVPYFHDQLTALLTFSRFAAARYLWPSLSGTGQCADFSRPLVPDSRAGDWAAWAALAAWAVLAAAAARAAARRQAWGFWILGPALFLLPTCHILVPLDTLGAERFLYLPSLGLAALLGAACGWAEARRPAWGRLALAAAVAWYAGAALRRNRVWLSEQAYYEDAVRCNPVSAKSRAALGTVFIEKGDIARGEAHLLAAMALDPALPQSYYNLARLSWDRGDLGRAEALARRAVELDASATDAKVLLALCLEKGGRFAEAASLLSDVLAAMPWNTEALFNLGRLELAGGRPAQARPLFARFAELAPDDPDAARARELTRP